MKKIKKTKTFIILIFCFIIHISCSACGKNMTDVLDKSSSRNVFSEEDNNMEMGTEEQEQFISEEISSTLKCFYSPKNHG